MTVRGKEQGSIVKNLQPSALDSSAVTSSGHSTGARSYITLDEVLYFPQLPRPANPDSSQARVHPGTAEAALESGRAADKSGSLGTIDPAAT